MCFIPPGILKTSFVHVTGSERFIVSVLWWRNRNLNQICCLILFSTENSIILAYCPLLLGVCRPTFWDCVLVSSARVNSLMKNSSLDHCYLKMRSICNLITLGYGHLVLMECSLPEWSSQLHHFESVKMHTTCFFFNGCIAVLQLMFVLILSGAAISPDCGWRTRKKCIKGSKSEDICQI